MPPGGTSLYVRRLVVVRRFAVSSTRVAVTDRQIEKSAVPPVQLRTTSPGVADFAMLRTTPSSRQPVVHVLVRPEPAVLRKQMSFGQLDPVYEKTAWFVVQVHFAPTPAAVPRAQLDENPPG